MLEAIQSCENLVNKRLNWTYVDANRIDDHIWWIRGSGKIYKSLSKLGTHVYHPGHPKRDLFSKCQSIGLGKTLLDISYTSVILAMIR